MNKIALLLVVIIGLGCAAAGRVDSASAVHREAEALLDQWHIRDGEEGFVVSDRMCLLFVSHPSEFLSSLTARENDLVSWLDRLPVSSFRSFGDPLLNREALRQMMITTLERLPAEPTIAETRRRLLFRLREIRVTEVN
jgi:hypothetical protein